MCCGLYAWWVYDRGKEKEREYVNKKKDMYALISPLWREYKSGDILFLDW